MSVRFYLAVCEPAADGVAVWFPDFPGCVSGGRDTQRALVAATEALQLHVEGMRADGPPLPEPSEPKRDLLLKGARAAYLPVTEPGQVERINLTIDKGLLALADRWAAERRTSRSALFADLIRRDAPTATGHKTRRIK